MIKSVNVELDDFTQAVSKSFDYEFDGCSIFEGWNKPKDIPREFSIGVIVGASGSGKSTLLNEFGEEQYIEWDKNKAIVSHFNSPEEAIDKLTSVGLNSIPSWVKPYHVLSTGEKFRADLSRRLGDNAIIDEFTSVVDRNVAKATSVAISKYIRKKNLKNIILATCHEDVLEWLEPDWVFNTNTGELSVGRNLRRPKIELSVYEGTYDQWRMFKNHHYMNNKLNKASFKYVVLWNNKIVGYYALMPLPSGTLKNAWRLHRLVILPDYQGMGIGSKLIDYIGYSQWEIGRRFFVKTAHIRTGEHMNNSDEWKPTSKNKKKRTDMTSHENGKWIINQEKMCYSYEYIGDNSK